MKKFPITIILLSSFLICSSYGQTTGPQSLDMLLESPAGSKIVRLIETINEGQEVTDDQIKGLFSKRLVDSRGTQVLKGLFEDVRDNDGQLELYEADRKSMFEFHLKLKSKKNNGWLVMPVTFESGSPYGIDGIQLNTTADGSSVEQPLLSPEEYVDMRIGSTPMASEEEVSAKAAEIARQYEEMNWFGGVVMLAKNGQPFFENAYGMADIKGGIKNQVLTKFRIGSINKIFTQVLVMQMVENNMLSFKDKLSQFELGFPAEVADKINIRQILNHSAGFADIFNPEYIQNVREYKDIDDILPMLMNEPLIFEPGTSNEYSNYGYIVLGAILEKVSGQKFESLVREQILDVVGMPDTHYRIAEEIDGEAQSYRFNPMGKKVDHTAKLEYPTPDGGMYSTARDLLAFFQALYYSDLLITDSMKAWYLNDYKDSDKTWNEIMESSTGFEAEAGGGPGVNAMVLYQLSTNYFVIVLANTDQKVAEEMGQRIYQAIKSRPVEEARLPMSNFVYSLIEKEGTAALRDDLRQRLAEAGYPGFNPQTLNSLGYDLLAEDDMENAIRVFHLNIIQFPKNANPYDSLAEAYYRQGDFDQALKYYKMALQLDPDFPSAKKMVKELEAK